MAGCSWVLCDNNSMPTSFENTVSTWSPDIHTDLQRLFTGDLTGMPMARAMEHILLRAPRYTTFVRGMALAMAWAGQQPWHAGIAWPNVMITWAERLRKSALPERLRRINEWTEAIRTMPQASRIATASYHVLERGDGNIAGAMAPEMGAYYVALGKLADIQGSYLKDCWINGPATLELRNAFQSNAFGCNLIPGAVLDSNLPDTLKMAFFTSHRIPQMWLTSWNKSWLQEHTKDMPLVERLCTIPFQGASAPGYESTNRTLVTTFFSEIAPALDMVVPFDEWTREHLSGWIRTLASGAQMEGMGLPDLGP